MRANAVGVVLFVVWAVGVGVVREFVGDVAFATRKQATQNSASSHAMDNTRNCELASADIFFAFGHRHALVRGGGARFSSYQACNE